MHAEQSSKRPARFRPAATRFALSYRNEGAVVEARHARHAVSRAVIVRDNRGCAPRCPIVSCQLPDNVLLAATCGQERGTAGEWLACRK